MAVGRTGTSDLIFREDLIRGALIERAEEKYQIFNLNSAGAIILNNTEVFPNFFEETSFAKQIEDIISRRPDSNSTSAKSGLKYSEDKTNRAKFLRNAGPVEIVDNTFIESGRSVTDPEVVIGQSIAERSIIDLVDVAIACLTTAISTISEATTAVNEKISTVNLVELLRLRKDKRTGTLLVLHSDQYYDLVKDQVGVVIDDVAGITIQRGTAATYGFPHLVLDHEDLLIKDSNGDITGYKTLLLNQGAALIERSVLRTGEQRLVGQQNMSRLWKGEYSGSVGIKGFYYDKSAGKENPDLSGFRTKANWDYKFVSLHHGAGYLATYTA